MILPSVDWKAVRDGLARARHAAGLTLDQLAARTGIDRSTIHRIENTRKRKSHNPDLDTIEVLVTAMGTSLSQFFAEIEAAHLNAQGRADNTAATPPHSSAVDHDRALSLEALADQEPETRAAGEQLRKDLTAFGPRIYDLRHSHLTTVYRISGDIRATQLFGTHADVRMTHRYTLAAVDPRLRAVTDLLNSSRTTPEPDPQGAETGQKPPIARSRAARRTPAKTGTKARKIV